MPQFKPTRGIRLNKSHPLARGLVGCWLFNEGSGDKVYDLSNGHNGTLVGSSAWTPGIYGSAITFSAAGAYINCGMFNTLAGKKQMSVVAFVKQNTAESHRELVVTNGGYIGGAPYSFYLRWQTTENYQFAIFNDAQDSSIGVQSGTTTDMQWHMVSGIYDGAFVTCWVDTTPGTPVACSLEIATATDVLGFSEDGSNFLDGSISMVLIYNRDLSPSEIAQLYREPFCFMEPSWNWILYGGISVPTGGGQVIFIMN